MSNMILQMNLATHATLTLLFDVSANKLCKTFMWQIECAVQIICLLFIFNKMHSIFCHYCLSFCRIMKCSISQAQNVCIVILGVITFNNRRQTHAFAPSSNRRLLAFASFYSACTAKWYIAKFKYGYFTEIRNTLCTQKQVQNRKL